MTCAAIVLPVPGGRRTATWFPGRGRAWCRNPIPEHLRSRQAGSADLPQQCVTDSPGSTRSSHRHTGSIRLVSADSSCPPCLRAAAKRPARSRPAAPAAASPPASLAACAATAADSAIWSGPRRNDAARASASAGEMAPPCAAMASSQAARRAAKPAGGGGSRAPPAARRPTGARPAVAGQDDNAGVLGQLPVERRPVSRRPGHVIGAAQAQDRLPQAGGGENPGEKPGPFGTTACLGGQPGEVGHQQRGPQRPGQGLRGGQPAVPAATEMQPQRLLPRPARPGRSAPPIRQGPAARPGRPGAPGSILVVNGATLRPGPG